MLIIIGIIFLFVFQKNSGVIKNISIGSSDTIKKLIFDNNSVVALTNGGNLYVIGNDSITDNKDINEVTKVDSGVVKLEESYGGIFYYDKKNTAYASTIDLHGGYLAREKFFDNVNTIATVNGLCNALITTNNELFFYNSAGQCFANEADSLKSGEFYKTIVSDAVIPFVVYNSYEGYVDKNGDAFATIDGINFHKILSNVKNVYYFGLHNLYVTNDNDGYMNANFRAEPQLEKLPGKIKQVGNEYYITQDGKLYDSIGRDVLVVDAKIDASDIKEYYWSSNDHTKYVYLNYSNKIVLKENDKTEELDLKVSNIKKIFDFVFSE